MLPSIVSPTAVMVTAAQADLGAAGAASRRVVSVPVRLSASMPARPFAGVAAGRLAVVPAGLLTGVPAGLLAKVPAGLVSPARATLVAAGWPKCRPPEQAGSTSQGGRADRRAKVPQAAPSLAGLAHAV